MNETLMTNIFFIITGAAIVIVTFIWILISLQIYSILRKVRALVHSYDDEIMEIKHGITLLRKKIMKKILG